VLEVSPISLPPYFLSCSSICWSHARKTAAMLFIALESERVQLACCCFVFFFFFLSCCLVTLSQRCVRDRETERRLKRQRFDFLRRNVFFFLIFSFDLSYDQLLLKALFLFLLWLISCPVQAKKKRNILARSIDKL
jgi:hypothetical protein